MAYDYTEERPKLFTEEGYKILTAVRSKVAEVLTVAGAVRMGEVTRGIGGQDWLKLAALDYMVEKGVIREIPQERPIGQHRIFVLGREW